MTIRFSTSNIKLNQLHLFRYFIYFILFIPPLFARFQMHFQYLCSKMCPKSSFLQTIYLSCVWKWIWSREQNSAPESRRASLHSVKVIKTSRVIIDRFLISCSLHKLLCCCKTASTTFLHTCKSHPGSTNKCYMKPLISVWRLEIIVQVWQANNRVSCTKKLPGSEYA